MAGKRALPPCSHDLFYSISRLSRSDRPGEGNEILTGEKDGIMCPKIELLKLLNGPYCPKKSNRRHVVRNIRKDSLAWWGGNILYVQTGNKDFFSAFASSLSFPAALKSS